jgi:hypothetical protein
MKSLPKFVLHGLRDCKKPTKAFETRLKQPQNGIRLSSNPALRSKRNRTKEKYKKRGHLQK